MDTAAINYGCSPLTEAIGCSCEALLTMSLFLVLQCEEASGYIGGSGSYWREEAEDEHAREVQDGLGCF